MGTPTVKTDVKLNPLLRSASKTIGAASQESGTNDAIRMYGCTADVSFPPLPSLALEVARVHFMVCRQVWQLEGQQFLDTVDIIPVGKKQERLLSEKILLEKWR